MGADPIEEGKQGRGRFRERKAKGAADWMAVNGAVVLRAIAYASQAGGALRFGYSRDGGAFAVGIYGDGEPYTEFEPDAEQVEILLADLADFFEEAPRQQAPVEKRTKRR